MEKIYPDERELIKQIVESLINQHLNYHHHKETVRKDSILDGYWCRTDSVYIAENKTLITKRIEKRIMQECVVHFVIKANT